MELEDAKKIGDEIKDYLKDNPAKKNVLILDDDSIDIAMFRGDISNWKGLELNLFEAIDEEQALKHLSNNMDVAFIDRFMYKKEIGPEFIKNNANKFPNTRFYLYSKDVDSIEETIIKYGGKGVINKRDAFPPELVSIILSYCPKKK